MLPFQPPGIPTPDPALLTGAVKDPVGWGYPEGEPTPDPALLNGIVVGTEAPTSRQVEVAIALPPPPPPTTAPLTKPIDLTLKTVDITPLQPREPPPPVPQVEVLPIEPPPPTPQPVEFPDTEVGTTLDNREPTIPRPPPEAPKIDQYGNPVEMAIPERQPRPPGRVPARPPRAPTNPQPKVVSNWELPLCRFVVHDGVQKLTFNAPLTYRTSSLMGSLQDRTH